MIHFKVRQDEILIKVDDGPELILNPSDLPEFCEIVNVIDNMSHHGNLSKFDFTLP